MARLVSSATVEVTARKLYLSGPVFKLSPRNLKSHRPSDGPVQLDYIDSSRSPTAKRTEIVPSIPVEHGTTHIRLSRVHYPGRSTESDGSDFSARVSAATKAHSSHRHSHKTGTDPKVQVHSTSFHTCSRQLPGTALSTPPSISAPATAVTVRGHGRLDWSRHGQVYMFHRRLHRAGFRAWMVPKPLQALVADRVTTSTTTQTVTTQTHPVLHR